MIQIFEGLLWQFLANLLPTNLVSRFGKLAENQFVDKDWQIWLQQIGSQICQSCMQTGNLQIQISVSSKLH